MKIAIVGNGRMGTAVAALGSQRGHSIRTVVDSSENAGGRALTRERLAGVDVAIEFTRPDAAVANLERLIEARDPHRDWDDRMEPMLCLESQPW